MKRQILLDTGIIVSLLSRQDQLHDWTTKTIAGLDQPLLTCEAVITEACFLLRSAYGSQQAVFTLLQQDIVRTPFCLADEVNRISELMARYENIPMSLADACLVRMAELNLDSLILTLDSDFRVYRKHRNQEIPVLMPGSM
jgi:uncharacterized protein